MKYQPKHDLIDPDYPAPDEQIEPVEDPNASSDAYIFDENGNTVLDLGEDPSPKERKKKAPPKWVMPAAFVLSTLFVGMTVWNISRAISGPPPLPKPSPFQVKQALYLGVLRVDAYKREHGVTPDSLLDVGLSDTAGYSYVRIDSQRYVLSFRVDGPKLEYDSHDAKELFFGEAPKMMEMGGTR
jgi:hypothetical protein